MDIGDKQYTDEEIEFTSLPSNLYGAEWIKTSNKKEQNLVFKVNAETDVFVLADESSKLDWLAAYENTNSLAVNSKGIRFNVFRKRFAKGDEVKLGEKALNTKMYSVAILPPTNLEPAYDLKTVTNYKATDAVLKGTGLAKADLMGRQRVVFNNNEYGVLEFKIATGVADVYSLTLKYHNPFSENLKAKLEFLSADGTLMKTEMLELTPTKEGKWNYLNTNTGSMINAGSYLVRITATETKGLYIDALDVQ